MKSAKMVPIKSVKLNPKNPRVIKDDKFKKLVNSIKEFPKMLQLRPIVVNKSNVVLGGNQRLKACIEAGLKEIPVLMAEDLSKAEQERFIIADNVNFGDWDSEILTNWEEEKLIEWGLDFDSKTESEIDFSEKNKELNIVEFTDNMTLKFTYSETQYNQIKSKLLKIDENLELALWKLVNGKA
jgi:ParB-like chromosome segregation protein Spo0J